VTLKSLSDLCLYPLYFEPEK